MREIIPSFIREQFGGTTRSFKQAKREEADEILDAINEFRLACAWIPREAYDEFQKASAAIKAMRDKLSLDNWGR